MIDPKNQGIEKKQIPTVQTDGANVKVIAGKVKAIVDPVKDLTIDIEYLDVDLAAGKIFEHLVPRNNTVFAYVVEGSIVIAGKQVLEGQYAVLSDELPLR